MISARQIHKRFGPTQVLRGAELEVAAHEIVALLGPSGCGKTTLLRVLAGLERPDAGEVLLGGELMSAGARHVPPERRQVGLVFQDFALFPHLTVEANVAFGLGQVPRSERAAIATEVLARFELGALGRRYPHELSGGQQQRVALARALAPRPRVLLMDEPFSSLDASLRRRLRVELRETLRQIGVATVFVTHDQEEALSLADRVAVLDAGRVAQVDTPEVVYRRPATLAVARATGQVVVVPGVARAGRVSTAIGELGGAGPDGRVQVFLRPEQLALADGGVEVVVEGRDYVGPEAELWCRLGDLRLVVRLGLGVGARPLPEVGARVRLAVVGTVAWGPA